LTGNHNILCDLIENASEVTKSKFEQLMLGKAISEKLSDFISFEQIKAGNESLFWSALFYLGYLKIIGESDIASNEYLFAIPNLEVEHSYTDIFQDIMQKFDKSQILKNSFLALGDGDVETFKTELHNFLQTSVSFHDTINENSYHMLVLGILSGLRNRYRLLSNRESGEGRADVIMVPLPHIRKNDLAIILEFKHGNLDLAEQALQQIQSRNYQSIVREQSNIKRILNIAIAFKSKQFKCSYYMETVL
jgi:hypothetical protein